MKSRWLVLASVVILGTTAATAAPEASGPPAPSSAFEYRDGQWHRRADSCGTPAHALAPTPPVFAGGTITVYLNKNGGTYHGAGATSSASNATALISSGTFTIPAMGAQFNWANLKACIIQHYAAYDVAFTETEPTSGTYIEAVIGGQGNEIPISLPGGGTLLGIASADNFCGVTQRGIAFSFSAAHLGIPRAADELCATVAHEVGHLLSLEHETLSRDIMSYVPIATSNTKDFVNQSSACGTEPGAEQSCTCGGAQTNSAARLLANVGTGTPTPPNMSITDPADGAQVEAGFPVHAEADEALAKAELRIDGLVTQTITTPPYAFNAPGDLGEGTHQVEVRGYDLQNTPGSAMISVTIGSPCDANSDCADDQVCVGGRCVLGPGSSGGLGETCAEDADCASNLCLISGSESHCVEACQVGGDDCPGGFDCLSFEGGGVCWPGDGGGGGGGCAATGGNAALPAGLGVLFAALVARRRRRR